MTRDELGKLNYNVYKTFAVFKRENKDITPWEDLSLEEQEPWVVAALEVSERTLDPDVKAFKAAAELKTGDTIFGVLSWMNGPVKVIRLGLSYDLKMVNVTTQGKCGIVETEFYDLDKQIEVQL
jgi:hypothetical protein